MPTLPYNPSGYELIDTRVDTGEAKSDFFGNPIDPGEHYHEIREVGQVTCFITESDWDESDLVPCRESGTYYEEGDVFAFYEADRNGHPVHSGEYVHREWTEGYHVQYVVDPDNRCFRRADARQTPDCDWMWHEDWYESYSLCEDCNCTLDNDDTYSTDNGYGPLCEACFNNREEDDDPDNSHHIREYSWKPGVVRFFVHGTRKPNAKKSERFFTESMKWNSSPHDMSRLFMGWENELQSRSGTLQDNAEHLATTLERWVYLKSDSSVSSGFEIVSYPGTLPFWQEMVRKGNLDPMLNNPDLRVGHDELGLHVHCNRSSFRSDMHMYSFGSFLTIHRDWCRVLGGRGLNGYCEISGDRDKMGITRYAAKKGRRVDCVAFGRGAINYSPRNTVEARFPKATTSKTKFLQRLEAIDAAFEFTKDRMNPTNIIEFSDWVRKQRSRYPNLARHLAANKELITDIQADIRSKADEVYKKRLMLMKVIAEHNNMLAAVREAVGDPLVSPYTALKLVDEGITNLHNYIESRSREILTNPEVQDANHDNLLELANLRARIATIIARQQGTQPQELDTA